MIPKSILMIALQLAASGADAYYTDRLAAGRPFRHEENPIAAPFVVNRPGRIAYFSVTTGIKLSLPPLLRKHKHNRLATAAELIGITDSAVCAARTARWVK